MTSTKPAVELARLDANQIGGLTQEHTFYIIINNYGTLGSPAHSFSDDARLWAAALRVKRAPANSVGQVKVTYEVTVTLFRMEAENEMGHVEKIPWLA